MRLFYVLCAALLLQSCTDSKSNKEETTKNPTVITRYDKSLVIAYYHQDSLKERFDYYKKEDQVITRKQKMFEAEMKRRGKELEDYVRRNDEKARNGLLSQNEIMQIQSQISWELNQTKVGKIYKCVIDRKQGNHFVGRTEIDSPDVDNEVLIDAEKFYLKTGDFAVIEITEATDFDLYGVPVKK